METTSALMQRVDFQCYWQVVHQSGGELDYDHALFLQGGLRAAFVV